MSARPRFEQAFPFRADVLSLPVTDLDAASAWYSKHFGMIEVAREMRAELESNSVPTGNWRVDERDGKKLQVFFVVAPDGLCYCFHQPIDG